MRLLLYINKHIFWGGNKKMAKSNFVIMLDGSCDLPNELCEKYDFIKIPHYLTMDKENYIIDNGKEITNEEFYRRLIDEKLFPKTAFPTMPDFIDMFSAHMKEGKDVLCLAITSKFSGVYQALCTVREELLETFPDRKMAVVDSRLVSAAEGFAALEASRMREVGFTLEKTVEFLDKMADDAQLNITVDSLEHLKNGGRIGKTAALAGSILNVKPIITLKDGELMPHSKVRGRKKAIAEILNMTIENLKHDPKDYNIVVVHSTSKDDSEYLKNQLEEKINMKLEYENIELGIIVGSHIGPTVCAICCYPKYEKYSD